MRRKQGHSPIRRATIVAADTAARRAGLDLLETKLSEGKTVNDKEREMAERLAGVMALCERNLIDFDRCMALARIKRAEQQGNERHNDPQYAWERQ